MRQCELLDLCRSGLYYQPQPVSQADLALMRRIDELPLAHPFLGARRLARMLQREGVEVGRRHVGTLMRRMGIEAIYRKRRTSLPETGHKLYPYLLGTVAIERPNQVWAADITYLPMARGFAYLVAILDLSSRKVLSFRVSNAMTTDFCVEALEEAMARYGRPEIVNTDQGSQFTASAFIEVLQRHGIAISMDGRGSWRDNVFVERFWRTLKDEEVYLRAYETVSEARASIAKYVAFYNTRRPHSTLNGKTPDAAYFASQSVVQAA